MAKKKTNSTKSNIENVKPNKILSPNITNKTNR